MQARYGIIARQKATSVRNFAKSAILLFLALRVGDVVNLAAGMWFGVLPVVMCIGTLALVLANHTTIFDTLGIISSGYLKPEDAMKLLMIGPKYTQVAIKTEKAVKQLRWIRAEAVTKLDAKLRKAEQEAFDLAFAEVLQEIVAAKE